MIWVVAWETDCCDVENIKRNRRILSSWIKIPFHVFLFHYISLSFHVTILFLLFYVEYSITTSTAIAVEMFFKHIQGW